MESSWSHVVKAARFLKCMDIRENPLQMSQRSSHRNISLETENLKNLDLNVRNFLLQVFTNSKRRKLGQRLIHSTFLEFRSQLMEFTPQITVAGSV